MRIDDENSSSHTHKPPIPNFCLNSTVSLFMEQPSALGGKLSDFINPRCFVYAWFADSGLRANPNPMRIFDLAEILPLHATSPRHHEQDFPRSPPAPPTMTTDATSRPQHIEEILSGLDRYNPETVSVFQDYVQHQCDTRTYDNMANLALLKL